MAVNLATKYSDKIATAFTHASYVRQNVSNTYSFEGAKTIKVYTPVTVEENDYKRSGSNRYGQPVEMEDTVQEMTLTQDKSFSLTIDKGNNMDQMNVKAAGEMLKLQLREKSTPKADKYALHQFATYAGTVVGGAKPTKSTIITMLADAAQALDDAQVPEDGRVAYLSAELVKFVRISDEFIGIDPLGQKSISRGEVGEIFGMKVVKIPGSYMPTGAYFIITHKSAVLMPYKIQDTKIHKDPPGISGDLLEGRHYYDAFVLGAKAKGVYALVDTSAKLAAPTVEIATHSGTITQAEASQIYYTLDGSDPRYSDSRVLIATGGKVTTETGQALRAVAFGPDGKFTSDVAEDKDDG